MNNKSIELREHTEEHTNCISTYGEKYCFDSITEMHKYHDSIRPWYQKIWEGIYYPIYRFFYWKIWDNIRPSTLKHLYQRAKQGWSYQDCWSIDWYLSDILPKMLRELKKNKHGHPHGLSEDEWNTILEDIAYGFDLQYQILDHKLYDFTTAKSRKTVQAMFDRDPELHKGCRIITKEEKTAIKQSWKLLQKYFYNLWD